METLVLALCFFVSVVANVALMAAVIAKRQRTSLEFSGQTLKVSLHQGNVHLITGLVLYEKGRHEEAVAMLQEAIRHDPQDMMADAMLQIALHSGTAFGVKGLAPSSQRFRLTGRTADAGADGIIEADVRELTAGDGPLLGPVAVESGLMPGPFAPPESDPETVIAPAAEMAVLPSLAVDDEASLALAVKEGLTLVRNGGIAEALAHFEALLTAHPDSRIARTGLAIALKHAGREDEAAEVLRDTLIADGAGLPARNHP